MAFKFLPHTADVKIQAEGKSLEDAFRQSALALKEVMSDKTKIKAKIKREFSLVSENKESLLYDFLEQFLYLFDAENFMLAGINEMKITKTKKGLKLNARVAGDNSSDYKFTNEVKAITYNEMKIQEEKDKVTITFVLDV